MKQATYLLVDAGLTKVLDRLDVTIGSGTPRLEAEVKWFKELGAGATIWASLSIDIHDMVRIRAEVERRNLL
jgi:hypothetical protein